MTPSVTSRRRAYAMTSAGDAVERVGVLLDKGL
jgi:hypothetical protein